MVESLSKSLLSVLDTCAKLIIDSATVCLRCPPSWPLPENWTTGRRALLARLPTASLWPVEGAAVGPALRSDFDPS